MATFDVLVPEQHQSSIRMSLDNCVDTPDLSSHHDDPAAGEAGQVGSSGQLVYSGGRAFHGLLEHLLLAHNREVGVLHAEVSQLRTELALLREDRGATSGLGSGVGSMETQFIGSAVDEASDHERPGDAARRYAKRVNKSVRSLSSTHTDVSKSIGSSKQQGALPFDKPRRVSWTDQNTTGLMSLPKKIVASPWFEFGFAAVIMMNAVVMAAEVQYIGIDLGVNLEYPKSDRAAADAWPGAVGVFNMLGYIFGILFTVEITLKVLGQKIKFCRDPWNWIDLTLVLLWFFAEVTSTPQNNAQLFRLARLGRLVRLIRLVRTIQGFDSLYLMTTALHGSLSVLSWACLLLFVFQMMLALFLNQMLTGYLEDDAIPMKERREIYEYFGTFNRSMLSMFEITLANWPPVCRLLTENVNEMFMLFCIAHKLTIGFAVVGVINGVFMQETFKVASTDDVIMVRQRERATKTHAEKMTKLFTYYDRLGEGFLTLEQFREVVSEPSVKTWLASMELDASDADNLYSLIDDGDGQLSAEELIRGVARLKGAARAIDLVSLMRQNLKLHDIAIMIQQAQNAGHRISNDKLGHDVVAEHRDVAPIPAEAQFSCSI